MSNLVKTLAPILLLVGPATLPSGCAQSKSTGMIGPGDTEDTDTGTEATDSNGGEDTLDAGDTDLCTGTLCGQPATCCQSHEECIENKCLPICATGVRCGANHEICCSQEQVCLEQKCVSPGKACVDSYDCEQPGEFCEPTLDKCLPQPDPLDCEVLPRFDDLQVTVEWSFETDEIISIPVVADLTGGGTPEVVLNLTKQVGNDWQAGTIAILDGTTGVEMKRIPHDPDNGSYGSHGRSTIALGDVSGDGKPDIIYASRPISDAKSLIVAVDHTGKLLWKSHDSKGDYLINVQNGAATLANFDGDDETEVVFGATLIDHTGLVVWDEGGNGAGGAKGTNENYIGGISAVADLSGNGKPEIISGKDAWQVDWHPGTNPEDPPSVTVSNYWTYDGNDGYPAVADLDLDGKPEVILVALHQVIALSGQSGNLWCGVDPSEAACLADDSKRTRPIEIPGGATDNRGGPPTVADFDNDGKPEVGVAGGHYYSVYDFNRAGETVVQPKDDLPPEPGDIFVRWSFQTQDLSSNATGSSVFDFQGDGSAEVIYADECYMRVYSGSDGSVQLEIPNTSSTIHEYPLVVDVDADGNSEILIVANETTASQCTGITPRQGLYVYGDVNDEWVPTRRVWTQHTYHVTNATSAGNVPSLESDNWTMAGLNNYRQNVQGDGVFNAPDLTVDLSVALDGCPEGKVELLARVSNVGALGVSKGVIIDFYEGDNPTTGTHLGTETTTESLLPGASTVLRLTIDKPPLPTNYLAIVSGKDAQDAFIECDEENNSDRTTGAYCGVIQ